MKKHEKTLGITETEMSDHIADMVNANENIISDDYICLILEKIIGDVMTDMAECADNENWNDDDIRLAVGRVLCRKLHIDI